MYFGWFLFYGAASGVWDLILDVKLLEFNQSSTNSHGI